VKVVVVGGGGAGCLASLMLARAGHDVTLIEKDRLKAHPDIESAAASAFRASAPQIVQPHIVMAHCRELLAHRLPDVYAGLLSAGVVEAPLTTQMPASLADKSSRPGDERLTQLLSRRSTIDWVLLQAAMDEQSITVRNGVRVCGLIATSGHAGAPPVLRGIRTDHDDVHAELIVDASGRRSALDEWLTEIGARKTSWQEAECGLAYYSRHYRLRAGSEAPSSPLTRTVMALDELTVGIWPGDNGTMQMGVVPLAADRRFRALKEPAVFTSVLRTLRLYADWLEVLDPITGVYPMGGLRNTLRRLVVDGVPVATGLLAIGDSVCTTNPTLARGLSMALTGAVGLVDVVEKHTDDALAQAYAFDDLVTAHIAPFYEEQAIVDGARLRALRHAIYGDPLQGPPPLADDRVNYWQVRAAMPFDPVAFRGFWRIMGMVSVPEEVYSDPAVVTATQNVLAQKPVADVIEQPSREQLMAALNC
jgi:2-polyprenyl-6-methoxyphenol hydroxylase-like FAD-dependent oxidoreductase